MTTLLINLPTNEQEVLSEQERFRTHPFLVDFQTGEFSISFAKRIVATQLGYNFEFLKALTMMRRNFALHPDFICTFLDPHMATEFGSNLDAVGLKQSGTTHIQMIYHLASSLQMKPEELCEWGSDAQSFFEGAMLGLIGGFDLGRALGALYADEVFAGAWFPSYYEGFKNLEKRTGKRMNLEFFDSHANEVEPAHVDHAFDLLKFREDMGLEQNAFVEGYTTFEHYLSKKFMGLHSEMLNLRASLLT
jgi:hypothetical protein